MQILARGLERMVAALGPDILLVAVFMLIMTKLIPYLMPAVLTVVHLFMPGQPLGFLLFGLGECIYGVMYILYHNCVIITSIIQAYCIAVTDIDNAILGVVNSLGINIGTLPNLCSANVIQQVCSTPPTNPFASFGTSGVGLCDASLCQTDVLSIISLLAATLPTCAQWVANAQATTACMNTVYAFSVANSTSSAQAPIDTISKELCFVLTATIVAQCSNSLPPFSFSYSSVAENVCVIDKSGLSPPAPPFNDVCACDYSVPLCNAACCNQYALHTIGQIKSYIGGYTCGAILAQFPAGFWCQFETLQASQVPPNSDLTFSADWCAAYQMVINPACTFSSPTIHLNAIDLSVLTADFSSTFCASTTTQVGVCVRKTVGQGPSFDALQFNYERAVVGPFNPPPQTGFFPGTPIVTIPQLGDTTAQVINQDIQRFYCYYFAILFNASTPLQLARQKSVLGAVGTYCTRALRSSYGTFNLQSQIYTILRTATGEPNTGTLTGIPIGTPIFGSSLATIVNPNGTAPLAGIAAPDNCDSGTGASIQETNDYQVCAQGTTTATQNSVNNVGSNGTMGAQTLQNNQQNMNPVAHLDGVTAIDPNDPQATQKQNEQQQVMAAKTAPTTWNIPLVGELADETVTFRTTYVANANPLTYSGRGLLSVEDSNMTDILGAARELLSLRILVNGEEPDPPSEGAAESAPQFKDLFETLEDDAPPPPVFSITVSEEEEEEDYDDLLGSDGGWDSHPTHALGGVAMQRPPSDARAAWRAIRRGERADEMAPAVKKFLASMSELGDSFQRMRDTAIETVYKLQTEAVFMDPFSAKDEPLFTEQRARRGKRRMIDALKIVETERAEIRTQRYAPDDPRAFVRSRKLLALIYDPTEAAERARIDAMWEKIVDLELQNSNIAPDALETLRAQQAINDLTLLAKHSVQVYIPALVRLFYGVDNTTGPEPANLGDYSATYTGTPGSGNFGSASPSANCENSFDDPLRCCTASSSPYDCCKGLPPGGIFCFKPWPDAIFVTVTTNQNVCYQWSQSCRKFRSFADWWFNTFRVIITAVINVIQYEIPKTGFLSQIFKYVTFPNTKLPPNPLGCMIAYSSSLWISILVGYLIFLFLATQLITTLIVTTTSRMETITTLEMAQAFKRRTATQMNQLHANIRRLQSKISNKTR
jgi:hypothetical protein